MMPTTAEWVAKAEADFASLERESQVTGAPNFDLVCFLAQQCAEKYLKARLNEASIRVPKMHDLVSLLTHVLPAEPSWSAFRSDLGFLSRIAVRFRYPGDTADRTMALRARQQCEAFRSAARAALGLAP